LRTNGAGVGDSRTIIHAPLSLIDFAGCFLLLLSVTKSTEVRIKSGMMKLPVHIQSARN